MEDPEPYLNYLEIKLPCAVRDGEFAVVDATHRRYVNWEIFFFSSVEAANEFTSNPLPHCGLLTDPVTRGGFRPDQDSPRWEYNGRPYYFPSDSAMAVFRTMPDSLAVPRPKMLSMNKEND